MAKGISAEAREDILVQAFLTCPNISEISKKTKIPRPTIYTVIHSDSFQRKYSEARNEAVTGAIAYLQGKLGECAAVLVNTATDTEVPAQIRVNAANAALSQCSQWTKNVDVIERLKIDVTSRTGTEITAEADIMNIQARLKQAEERAMLLQKKANTIHLIMVKPVPGKERLYTILGGDGIYNEKKLAEFQQKHSVVTTIILNIPRLPEEGVLNAEKK